MTLSNLTQPSSIPYSAGGPNRSAEVSLLPLAEVSPAEVIPLTIKKFKDLPLFISLFLFAKLQFNPLVFKFDPNILTPLYYSYIMFLSNPWW